MAKGWRRIHRFGLLGLISLLTSCSTINTTVHDNRHLMEGREKPPMYEEFLSIYNEEYIFGKNDCSNKSSKYTRILIENGYDAAMLILWHEKSSYNHVIVLVTDKDGKRHYYDPTNYFWGTEVFDYSNYADEERDKDGELIEYDLWEILEEIRYEDRKDHKDGKVFLEYIPKGI